MNKQLTGLLLLLFFFSVFVTTHAFTHRQVYLYNDCTNVSMQLGGAPTAFASTQANCPTENIDQIENQQVMVESVGYQLFPAYTLLSLLLTFYITDYRKTLNPRRNKR